jgi:UDP-glucose 4-epimerase
MKNLIVITGGAGFVGSNLINCLLEKTTYEIISFDNYSTGKKINHIKNKRVKYLNGHTKNISEILKKYKKRIKSLFHFGEFARIYQSFIKMNECIDSNTIGTNAVFKFCIENKIRLIYSATSASLGNNGSDKNLSPYAFTKAKNLEMLENLRRWFNFKFEIVYFYNVYGPNQISKGDMATVIGIFQEFYEKSKPLPIVKPGTQTRRFTHVQDTVLVCYQAFKENKQRHYSISNKENYSIIEIAKLFKTRVKFLPKRRGERFASALSDMNLSQKVYKKYGSIRIKDYINNFIERHKISKLR